MDQHPQFLVHRLERAPLGCRHPLGGKAGAQRLELGHRLEHADQPVVARPRHHGAAMRAAHRPARSAASCRIASRTGVRDTLEAARNVGLVERGARRQRAAHDLVGELQPQFLARACGGERPATRDFERAACSSGRLGLDEADMRGDDRQPSGKRTQVCICRPTLPGADAR